MLRSALRRRRVLLWLVPATALVLTPQQRHTIPHIIASPDVIPPRRVQVFSPLERTLLRDKIWEPVLTAARFVYLLALFAPVIFTSPFALTRRGAIWWYDLLVSTMQKAGPTFIKLAQWAASRADLFPSALCDRLGALHSHGRSHSIQHTKRVIESVFQLPFEQVFEQFDETPIGTGAIAQVYRATLRQDLIPPSYLGPRRTKVLGPLPSVPSNAVAIKVLHPNVSKIIARDLSIMSFFAHTISILPGMQWLSLPEEVQVFGNMMFQQLDLRHEAENLVTFENNFSDRRVPVTFPRPLQTWSTRDLLVEEFQHALPLELFLRNGGGPYDRQVAEIGLDAFLNMLLLDNFVHTDLHPGNIMIKFSKPVSTRYFLKNIYNSLFHRPIATPPDDSESDSIISTLSNATKDVWLQELTRLSDSGYIPEIVFIDAGLVTTLSSKNRQNFLDLFRAIAQFDGYRAGQLMISRSRTPHLAIDTETFALKMQHLVLSVKRKTFSLGQMKISDILTEVLRMVRTHHVKMEGDFINTVLGILLLEGIGRQLDPGLDLFKSSLPILRKLGGQMAAREGMTRDLPSSHLGALLKVWVWLEAREFINASVVNADDLVKYDWLAPSL